MATGVTDFIKISEVRKEIDSTYPNPGVDAEGDSFVPNTGYSHKLIGDTFEFLCKLWLYRHCDEVIRPDLRSSWELNTKENEEHDQTWLSADFQRNKIPEVTVSVFAGMEWEDIEHGPSNKKEWEEMNENRQPWERRSAVRWEEDEELSKVANQYVKTGMNTDGVVQAALFNSGWKPDDEVQSWVDQAAIEDDLLTEMKELFNLLGKQDWGDGKIAFEGPKFGHYRHILPGEGDFLVDDLLVDIKTTENRSFTNSFWRQLLMYYVLNDIQRELHQADSRTGREKFDDPYPEITRVGIYFARYGELQTIDIDEVIQDTDRYEEFRAWIVDKAIEENRHAQINYSGVRSILTDPYDYKRQQSLSDF